MLATGLLMANDASDRVGGRTERVVSVKFCKSVEASEGSGLTVLLGAWGT